MPHKTSLDGEHSGEHAKPGRSKALPKPKTPDRTASKRKELLRRGRHHLAYKSSNSKSEANTKPDSERQEMPTETKCLEGQASSTKEAQMGMRLRNSERAPA